MSLQAKLPVAIFSFTAGFSLAKVLDKQKANEVLNARDFIMKADAARQAALQHPERIPVAIQNATKSLIEGDDKNNNN